MAAQLMLSERELAQLTSERDEAVAMRDTEVEQHARDAGSEVAVAHQGYDGGCRSDGYRREIIVIAGEHRRRLSLGSHV